LASHEFFSIIFQSNLQSLLIKLAVFALLRTSKLKKNILIYIFHEYYRLEKVPSTKSIPELMYWCADDLCCPYVIRRLLMLFNFFYEQFSIQVLFCFPSFSVLSLYCLFLSATDEEKILSMFKYSGYNKPWPKLCSA
jgi:hypothetical protein